MSKHKGRQPGAKAKRCTDGYGVKSVRIMAKAKERGLHLNAGGQIVLPSGKVHQGTPQWGRDRINLSIDGERVLISTARVVCFLAHGNPPHPTSVADHIDGNTLNDHPDNLRWATYSENTRNTSFARSETWEMKAIRACTGMADPQAEIAVLREQVQTLREALQRIYSAAERHLSEQVPSDSDGWYEQPISVLEQARRALTPTAPEANP